MNPELTESDYDALFAAMKQGMSWMNRELFPKILAQLGGDWRAYCQRHRH